MKTVSLLAAVGIVALAIWVFFPGQGNQEPKPTLPDGALVAVTVPEITGMAVTGKIAFEAKCATCHGLNAAGREGAGPPLVHKIYEPSHHGDGSFQLAVQQGVRSHHWNFGNMPPVDGVTVAEVKMIVDYVRQLQRANGIN